MKTEIYDILSGSADTSQSQKTILYWTPWWNNSTWYFGDGSDVFSNCPVSNCFITDNRSFSKTQDFDAVLFHSWNLFETDLNFPEIRSTKQRFTLKMLNYSQF